MSNITTTTTTGFAPQMQEYGLAQAQNVMNLQQQPYQPYSTNPNAFAAPMNSTQVAGAQNINNAAGMAQPYYANATSTLGNYLGAGTAALGQAYNTIGNAQNTGAVYNQAGMAGYQGAVQTGNAYNQAAAQGYAGAPAAASGYNNMAGQGYVGAYNTAAPYTQTATAGYAAAPGTSAPYNAAAGQGYVAASQAADPYNQAATTGYANAPGTSANYNTAAGQGYLGASQAANPYNQAATLGYAAAPGVSAGYNVAAGQGYLGASQSAAPLNQAAIQGYAAAPSSSATQNAAAQAGYTGAANAANPYNQTASQGYAAAPGASAAQNAAAQAAYANAPGSVSQYNQSALQGFNNSVSAATPLNQAAIKGYTDATGAANPYNLAAAQGYATAPGVATPYNQMAASAINNAVGAGSGYNQNAMANYTGGLAASMPYTLGGAQAVNAAPVDAAAISQYLSPFLNDVYKTTLAGQSVQNAQQSSALQGTAAQAGAFGGDRAGIAQANMAYQQNLANSQTNANLLNTGFTNALAAAQNQQNVNLGAQQANRAAQASTGQNIYNQMSNTGQNIAGLGQQVYGQNLGASTALSGLGNQMFGQQTAAAQGVGNIGQQIYGQQIGAAQGMGNMGQQISNQNINAAQGIGNIGQQQFGQQIAGAAGQLAAGNQGYNQAMGAAAGQANVGQQIYNQGAQTAAGLLGVGNQNYSQAMGSAQGLGNMGQQTYGQGAATAAGLLGVGNQNYAQLMGATQGLGTVGQQVYNQGAATAGGLLNTGQQNYAQAMGAAQGLGNVGQQVYNQGAATAGGLLNTGQQNYAQTMGAAQGIGAMGNQAFTQGNQTANSLAGLGNQTFNQNIASAQGLAGVGNQVYNQDAQAAQAALATGQNAFTQGATSAAQQAAIANSLNSMGLNAATTLGSLGGAAQTSALQGGQAQMTAGAVQQGIEQAGLNALLAQHNQEQAFPYTQASWGTNNLATIAGGLTGQTTTQTQPGFTFGARGGAIKPHARASGGLIPNAASEGGAVSMGRAGQGFADGGMTDPYMTNMYNILGSLYPNQSPAQPSGALAPSAPSGGFAPAPVGLPALANGAQYAGNPFAALLNTASSINPANYASANTAVKPATLAGTTASGYNPSAFLAPKATKEPWWKPPEAAKPAAATDATAATSAGLVPGGSEANAAGPSGQGGNLAGVLGLVNGDAFAGAKGAYSGLLSNVLGSAPGGLLGSAGRGLMDLLGLGNPTIQGNPAPTAPGPISIEDLPAPPKDDTVSTAPTVVVDKQDLPAVDPVALNAAVTAGVPSNPVSLAASVLSQLSPLALDHAPLGPDEEGDAATAAAAAAAAAGPAIDVETSDLGLGGSGTIGGTGKGDNNTNPTGVSADVNPGENNGPSGNGDSGEGSGEGASGKYRGGLIRPHRREGGPVRKHYATSGGVGIADSLYNNDPNSYGYIFGQGTSPASLDQNSYGSPAMNARMAERQQSALQQLAGVGSTLGGLKSGFGVVGDVLGWLTNLKQGGRVGRAGGGLVGRHGYAGDGTVDGQDDTAPPSRTIEQIIQSGNANYEAAQPGNVQAVIDREAARRNIPIPLARGLFRQESNLDPNITGSAGEKGLGQIKPSTARDPGFGMAGVDPSTLIGAENIPNNVKFALDYLQARGRAAGATDLNNPLHQNAALAAYNSGGDPNYVNNVRSRINEGGGNGGDFMPPSAGLVPSGNDNAAPGNNLSPVNQAASDAAVRIAKSLGNAKPDTTEAPNWFERNQNWLAPVLMGLAGASGKRTLAGAVVGAGAGAVQGLQAAQKSASERKLQAGQTEQATAGAQSAGASAVQALGSASKTPAEIALINSQKGKTEADTTAVLGELPARINLLEQQGVLTGEQANQLRTFTPIEANKKLAEMGLINAQTGETFAKTGLVGAETNKTQVQANQIAALTQPQVVAEIEKGNLTAAQAQAALAGLVHIVQVPGGPLMMVNKLTGAMTPLKAGIANPTAPAPEPTAPGVNPANPVPGNPNPANPGAPQPVKANKLDPVLAAPANYMPTNQETRYIGNAFSPSTSVAAAEASGAERNNAQAKRSENAQRALLRIAEMRSAARDIPSAGLLSTGPTSSLRQTISGGVDDIIKTLGGNNLFKPGATGAIDVLNKDNLRLGTDLNAALGASGSHAGFIVGQTMAATPGNLNSKPSIARLLSSLEQASEQETHRAAFYNDYFSRFNHLNGADQLFDKLNPREKYVEKAAINAVEPVLRDHLVKVGTDLLRDHPDARVENLQAYKTIANTYGADAAKAIWENR